MRTSRFAWWRPVLAALASSALLAGCGSGPPAGDAVPDPLRADVAAAPARDPAGLARQIASAEAAIVDATRPPEEVAAAGRVTQVAYGALADRPDWDGAVLAAVPPDVADAVRDNVAARRALLAMSEGPPGSRLPAWRIVEPWSASRLRAAYDEGARRFGVPWTVLAAINLVETRMGRIVGRSGADARGPMQFIPETWARYGMGGDVWDPRDAILGAANYLRASGAVAGDDAALDRAVWRYNNDVRYVRAVRAYATRMEADERALLGYHAWRVFVTTSAGTFALPTGYDADRSVPVDAWLARGRTPEPPG